MGEPVMHELHKVNMSFSPGRVGAAIRLFRLRQHWPFGLVLPPQDIQAIASVNDHPQYFTFGVTATKKLSTGGHSALLSLHGLSGLQIREDIARCHRLYTVVDYHDSGVSYTNSLLAVAVNIGSDADSRLAWDILGANNKSR